LQFGLVEPLTEADPPLGFRHLQHCYMYRCGSTRPFFTDTLNPLSRVVALAVAQLGIAPIVLATCLGSPQTGDIGD